MATKRQVAIQAKDVALGHISQYRQILLTVEEILGDGRKVSTIWERDPGAVAQLRTYGIGPLSWTDLTEKQEKQMKTLLPFRGPANVVQYGDAVLVIGTPEQWRKRRADKDRLSALKSGQLQKASSGRQLSSELGLPVEEAYVPIPPGYEVGGRT